MNCEVLIGVDDEVCGACLNILEPISFWGGVSAENGRLTEPRCAAFGQSVTGKIMLIRELRGSSSGSSVLLELVYRGAAPAAIVLNQPDAILAIGLLAAREMGWRPPPLFRLPAADQALIRDNQRLKISPSGKVIQESV
ncbi:DUF126 domain-containing protein [Phenylobacterium sp.]|uniref:aconitase X swivel domain-containing protein n=1 Tax=Phenylobacterium sp. TaxID=1871053 RepID=UPI00262A2120|nr:DUF126 domain-containing protein [Phenylobacterium sp.]